MNKITSKHKRPTIVQNLAVNYAGFSIELLVMFFLSPFVIHTLGKAEYGIWQILTVLTGYMGVLDMGVRASTGRYIAVYLGKEDHTKVDETIRTGLGAYAIFGIVVIFMSVVLGAFLSTLFPSVTPEQQTTAQLLLPVLAANLWISAFRTVLSSLLNAYERFDLSRISDMAMLSVRVLGTLILLHLGLKLVGLAIAVVVCNIVGLIVNIRLASKVHTGLRLWPLMLKKERLHELANYGFNAFLMVTSGKIIGQTDLIIVGSLISMDATAVYSVGAMLLYYSGTLLSQIDQTLFPTIQRAVTRREMGSVRWLLFRQIRLAMILGLAMFVGFIVFGESFIRLWMFDPENFPESSVVLSAQVMAVLAASKLLLLFTYGSHTILAAKGKIKFGARVLVVESVCNILLSIFFVMVLHWGLLGVAAGTIVSRLLTSTFIIPYHACRHAGINWRHYVVFVGGTGLTVGGLFALICFAVRHFLPGRNWLEFFLQVIISLVCYIPLAWFFLVTGEDRKKFKNKLDTLLAKT